MMKDSFYSSLLLRESGRARDRDEADRRALSSLTPREREVLALLGAGLSDKEMGERLFIGKDTVHTHMVKLMRKLGCESRMQALIFAIRYGVGVVD